MHRGVEGLCLVEKSNAVDLSGFDERPDPSEDAGALLLLAPPDDCLLLGAEGGGCSAAPRWAAGRTSRLCLAWCTGTCLVDPRWDTLSAGSGSRLFGLPRLFRRGGLISMDTREVCECKAGGQGRNGGGQQAAGDGPSLVWGLDRRTLAGSGILVLLLGAAVSPPAPVPPSSCPRFVLKIWTASPDHSASS